jgi:hypothetical protein
MNSDNPSEGSCCPKCFGWVACEGDGWRCIEITGRMVGCGWRCDHDDEPAAVDDVISDLRAALIRVRAEVTNKKGGPEAKTGVSIPYLFNLVTAVLDGKPRGEWPR